jgi:periplasmic protein TonB
MDMSLFCFSRVYRAMLLHLRNLLQPIATNSLTGMELRALLFTSDGGSTATLCHVLDELGLQAEICPELLVAVGRLSTERYDAIIVDWSQETEAAILLKTAREKKALALNVALVADEAAIGRALQQGANSVIKKPVDAAAARDTLSTARDLILSRRSEQREKETRAAAAQAQLQEQEDAIPEMPVVEDAAPKSGYLAQSMSKSALEAEQNMVKPEYESAPSSFQVARGPSAVQEEEAEPAPPPEPVSQKRWDEVRSVFRQSREEPEPEPESDIVPVSAPQTSHDSTGVFSSLSEESVPFEEAAAEPESGSLPRYLVFAVVAFVVVAAVLYVWAPGNSYVGKVTSAFHSFTAKSKTSTAPVTPPTPAPQEATVEKPSAGSELPTAEDAPPSDLAPVVSSEIDPSKIHIIETKVIPKPGAEQPPKDPANQSANPPDRTQLPAPDATAPATPDATPTGAPDSQPAAQPQPVAPPPVRPQPSAPAVQTAPGEGRTGVIIPDSLRNSPSASPASSLEPSSVPEETSLGLLIHRVEPEYPQQAAAQHLEGPVVLQAWVARDGTVRDVKLVRGYFVLARAAFDAVKQWRFKPYSPNGKAVDFQTVLTLNFKTP